MGSLRLAAALLGIHLTFPLTQAIAQLDQLPADCPIKTLSHERSDIAGAEGFHSLEGNMCGTAMRGADALPGSKATSRATGSHRKLGGLVSGRQRRVRGTVRIGKARSRSR